MSKLSYHPIDDVNSILGSGKTFNPTYMPMEYKTDSNPKHTYLSIPHLSYYQSIPYLFTHLRVWENKTYIPNGKGPW